MRVLCWSERVGGWCPGDQTGKQKEETQRKPMAQKHRHRHFRITVVRTEAIVRPYTFSFVQKKAPLTHIPWSGPFLGPQSWIARRGVFSIDSFLHWFLHVLSSSDHSSHTLSRFLRTPAWAVGLLGGRKQEEREEGMAGSACSLAPLADALLPTGFCAGILPVDLSQPRSIVAAVSSGDRNADFLALERGTWSVVAVRDMDGDGIPETKQTVATA